MEKKQTHLFAKGVIITLLFSIIIFLLVHTFLTYRYEVFTEPFESFAKTDEAEKLSVLGFNAQESMNQFQESYERLKEQLEEESEPPSTKVSPEVLQQLEQKVEVPSEEQITLLPFDISITLPMGYIAEYAEETWKISHEIEDYTIIISQEEFDDELQGEEIQMGGEVAYIVSQTFGTFDQKHEMKVILPNAENTYVFSAIMYNGSKDQFIEMTKDLIQRIAYAKEETTS